jgi:hypothetical protein
MGRLSSKEGVHVHAVQALSMRYRAILVCKQQRLQVDNLLAKLSDRRGESIVLSAEELNLGLKVGKPLFFALATLESSNPVCG